jgi:hypothetical protein
VYIPHHFHLIPKGSSSLCEMGGFGLDILLLCVFPLPIPFVVSCIIARNAFPHTNTLAFASYVSPLYILWAVCFGLIAGALTNPSYFDDRPLLAISLFPLIPAIAIRALASYLRYKAQRKTHASDDRAHNP